MIFLPAKIIKHFINVCMFKNSHNSQSPFQLHVHLVEPYRFNSIRLPAYNILPCLPHFVETADHIPDVKRILI